MALELESVRVSYGSLEVLHGIDLEAAGRITALLGPNGAGKTTTLNSIMGLLPISAGRITFEGKDITSLPTFERIRMGLCLVPEGRRLFSRMTVLENLLMGAFLKDPRKKMPETLKEVYDLFPILKEKARLLARNLSGGEQQMVTIARGLMSRPKLLLLDEPSLGLAPLMVDKIFQLIGEIARRGVSVLLVEQNLVQALELTDVGYVLEEGKVITSGKGPELMEDPHVRQAYLGL